MSYWYWRPLKSAWELNEGATNKFSLPEKGMLSGLAIQTVAVNNVTLSQEDDPYIPQRHSKIRVVGNGNFEIININGKQMVAIDCWDRGQNPEGNYVTTDTLYQRMFAQLPFGRFMGDPKFGIDLSKFAAGVEFEETNTFDTTDFTDTYQKMDIYGLFRKGPEAGLFAGGFLKKRQIINKDTATETQYPVKLPTLAKLKQIHLFSEPDFSGHVDDTPATTNVQYIWLGVKSREEYILTNIRSRTYAYWMHQIMKREFRTRAAHTSGAGGLIYHNGLVYRGEIIAGICHYGEASDHMVMTLGGDERVKQVYTMIGSTATAGLMAELVCRGIMLFGDIPLLMQGPLSEPETWLDAKEMADVYVEVTEGASTGNWMIVLDELEETYPT